MSGTVASGHETGKESLTGADLWREVEDHLRCSGESWTGFAARAGISTAARWNLPDAQRPRARTVQVIRAAIASFRPDAPKTRRKSKADPYRAPGAPARGTVSRNDGFDRDALRRRVSRDQELASERRRNFKGCNNGGGLSDRLRELAAHVDRAHLADPHAAIQELHRRWKSDWKKICSLAQADGVMPGIMLHRVVQAGLDCMQESDT